MNQRLQRGLKIALWIYMVWMAAGFIIGMFVHIAVHKSLAPHPSLFGNQTCPLLIMSKHLQWVWYAEPRVCAVVWFFDWPLWTFFAATPVLLVFRFCNWLELGEKS
jgi:hypothetical protein